MSTVLVRVLVPYRTVLVGMVSCADGLIGRLIFCTRIHVDCLFVYDLMARLELFLRFGYLFIFPFDVRLWVCFCLFVLFVICFFVLFVSTRKFVS